MYKTHEKLFEVQVKCPVIGMIPAAGQVLLGTAEVITGIFGTALLCLLGAITYFPARDTSNSFFEDAKYMTGHIGFGAMATGIALANLLTLGIGVPLGTFVWNRINSN